jgi:sugar lactone lactonase YvrE
VTRLPRGARCATHMTASASFERDSGRGSHRAGSKQPEIVFDGHPAIGGGAGRGDRQQRLLCLDIPHGRVHRFDPATGSDDGFGAGKPVGAVSLHTGRSK